MPRNPEQSSSKETQPKPSYLDEAINAVWHRDPTAAEGTAGQDYLKQIIKTVPLFMGGNVARLSAAAVGALDQMKPSDDGGTQAIDGLLGGTKGALTQASFQRIGGLETNFVVKGVAMGMTARTLDVGFNRETWVKDGEFRPLTGTWNTLSTTFDGKQLGSDAAVAGLGYLGLRGLNKAGLERLGESRFFGNIFAGTVFGGSSGAYQELSRQSRLGIFDPLALGRETLIHGGISGIAAIPGGLQGALRYTAADFGPLSPEQARANLVRLQDPIETTTTIKDKTNAKSMYESSTEFHNIGIGLFERPIREYSISGHSTKLQIPLEYDKRLPTYRQWRETAVQGLFDQGPMNIAHTSRVAFSRLALDAAGLRGRFLPEDLVSSLDRTPDSRLIKDIQVIGTDNPYDMRIGWRPTQKSSAMAELLDGGRLMFWRGSEFRTLQEHAKPDTTVQHEWAHLQQESNPKAWGAFKAALKLEEYGWDFHDYAKYNVKENWAVNSEPLLSVNREAFERLVDKAPIRATVLGRALEETLSNVPAELRNENHQELVRRAEYIRQHAEPKARQLLGTTGTGGAHSLAADFVQEFLDGRMTDARGQQAKNHHWEYDWYR